MPETRIIRAPRLPAGCEVGAELSVGGELVRVVSIQYDDRAVLVEVETLDP